MFVIRNKTILQIYIRFIEKEIKNLGLTMNNTVKIVENFKGPIFLLVSTEAKKHMIFSYIFPSNFDIYLYVKWTYNSMSMLRNKLKKEFHMCFSTSCLFYNGLEKAMATHSGTLAWEIPRMEEPGGLRSMGSQRVRHD